MVAAALAITSTPICLHTKALPSPVLPSRHTHTHDTRLDSIMETQTRLRPELRPVWTGREQHDDHPSPSTFSACSPTFPSSRRDSLLSPMYPASPGYDQSMRMHERALVDKLDQRGRRESRQSPSTARSLSPISEQALGDRRVSVASLPLPNAPAPSPRSPGFPMPLHRRPTIVAETRSILLSGLHDGLPRPQPADADTPAEHGQPVQPAVPGGRRNSQQQRQELQAWGHVYFSKASEASCFVSPLALRRSSEGSSVDEDAAAKGRSSSGSNSVTIRARVRPCALNRKPFVLKRTFDMDELRATVPELSPVPPGGRRPSMELPRRNPLPSGRRHSITPSPGLADLGKSFICSTNIPIRE